MIITWHEAIELYVQVISPFWRECSKGFVARISSAIASSGGRPGLPCWRLFRPASSNVDICSWKPHLEEDIDQEVNDNTETEELASPDTTAVVPFQAVDERKTAHAIPASLPALTRIVAVEFLGADITCDALVDSFSALGDVPP